MDKNEIVEKTNRYIHLATKMLSDWLYEKLPRLAEDWWAECVLDKLSYNQRAIAEERNFQSLADFDLAALLRLTDKNWYALRELMFLPTKERECVRRMISVRNNWAHCSGSLPGKDAIVSDIGTIAEFLGQLHCDMALQREVESFAYEIRNALGYGARWEFKPNDKIFFRGFLEPPMENGHELKWRH